MVRGSLDDLALVLAECRKCKRKATMISDGCARTIGSLYQEHLIGLSFSTTGAVPEDTNVLWSELFPNYESLPRGTQTIADMMAIYLGEHAGRGPVEGWHNVWVGRQ